MGILDDLSDLFADTLVAQPVTLDEFGAITPSGDSLSVPAYISGKTRLIRNIGGREVVSSVKAIVAPTAALIDAWVALGWTGWVDEDWVSGSDAYPSIFTTQGYRYTLPTRFDPRTDLEALMVKHASDEDGAHHEVIYFP